jgi:integrase
VTPLVGRARRIVEGRLNTAGADGRLFASNGGASLGSSLVGQYILARRKRLPVEKFATHDLRRTAATMMVKLGISLDIVAQIVGHEAGGKETRTLVRHYVHDDLIDRKVRALEAWDAHIQSIILEEPRTAASSVVQLDRRRKGQRR